MVNLIVKNLNNNEIVVDIIINKCNNSVVELVETAIKPYVNNAETFSKNLLKHLDKYGSNIDKHGHYEVSYLNQF